MKTKELHKVTRPRTLIKGTPEWIAHEIVLTWDGKDTRELQGVIASAIAHEREKLTKLDPVVVQVSGGVAEVIEQPKGIRVEIHDYDVEGCDESELADMEKDEDGTPYNLIVFE